MRHKNVQDPVWGRIELEDSEWKLLSLPIFQRLRRIHQLGMTMLVFPGATHSRFEHSLGACHAAGQIARRLAEEPTATIPFGDAEVQLARTAALLHDIGHGPFSHVSDEFLGDKGHEEFGAMVIERDEEVSKVIGSSEAKEVAAIIRGTAKRSVVKDIVSGPTDADKIDYLLRDSHYAGVEQGRFDYVRFIDQAVAISAPPYTQLGFHWGGLWAVEGMLLARHHMHRTVYGHRNRLITDFMLRRGLRAAMDQGVIPFELLDPPTSANYDAKVAAYMEWDDWSVFSKCVPSGGIAGEMFTRLRDHRLLKLLVFLEGDDLARELDFPANTQIVGLGKRLAEVGPKAEPLLATELSVRPELLFVRLEDPKQPLARPDDPNLADQDVIFVAPNGDFEPLQKRTEVLFGSGGGTARIRLLVYGETGRNDDEALAKRAKAAVIHILKSVIREVRDE